MIRGVVLSLLVSSSAYAQGTLTQAAEQQADPSRAALDSALRQLRSEDYGPAAVALFQRSQENAELADEAKYNL